MPGDVKPARQEVVCRFCGATMSTLDPEKDNIASTTCPSCKMPQAGIIQDFYEHKATPKGKQFNPFSTNNPMFIQQNDLNKNLKESAKKEKNYISDDFSMCPNLNDIKENDDDGIDEITKSCEDLEIDG